MVGELKQIEKGTCIRFKPRDDEIDYIEIGVSGDLTICWSLSGKQGKIFLFLIYFVATKTYF